MGALATHWTLDLELPSLQNCEKKTSVLSNTYSFWCSVTVAQDRTPLLTLHCRRRQEVEDNVEAILRKKRTQVQLKAMTYDL